MTARRIGVASWLGLPLGVSLLVAGVCARALAGGQFNPEVGQPGKDVVWVPTSRAMVQKMLDMASVSPQDLVIDLGSGDGRRRSLPGSCTEPRSPSLPAGRSIEGR
jgi:hypothetical protein